MRLLRIAILGLLVLVAACQGPAASGLNIVATGSNDDPNSLLQSYDIKTVALDGSPAWEITVRGGPFPLRAYSYFVWLGDERIGPAREGADLKSLTIVFEDPGLLQDGARLGVSYGEFIDGRIQFPEGIEIDSDG